ncbi:hypothetical protein [Paenarthrobacter sp. 22069]|uniref:hypothetical protein n=1 Tax=Paenarthrobacter sp. 22069 TaxID=3453864 RepID=UPI003F834946
MSRTGIHGGIRRGAAAAAVGAVLVLSTGVQASLADDSAPPPQDPAAEARVQGAAGGAPAPADRTPGPKAPSIVGVPGTLVPAVTATLSTASPAAAAGATADASATALPLPGLPLPTVSVTPLAPGLPSTASAAPAGSPSSPAPAASGSTTKTGSGASGSVAPAAGAGPAPAAGPATAGGPGNAAGPGSAAGDPAAAGQTETGPAGAGQRATDQDGLAGTTDAETGGSASTDATRASALPTALSINARNSQLTRAPQAAAPPASSARAVSSTQPLPDLQGPMVWLGAGLVGVGAAAGLVFVRMRKPF